MTSNTKFDEKLEGVDKFEAHNYRVMLILEENDIEYFGQRRSSRTKGRCGQGKTQEELG
jgi:hypothetical protein